MKGKRILVTGGAGFIGSHLCEKLVGRHELVVFDNYHRGALRYTDLLSKIQFHESDVLDTACLTKAMAGCQVVIHMAAIAGISSVINSPLATMRVNLFGTKSVLDAAVQTGVAQLLLFSTSEVYGPHVYYAKESDVTAQGATNHPRWSYAVSKLAAEYLAWGYSKEYDLPVTIIRPFNVYGPRQIGASAVRQFIGAALHDEPLNIHGGGNQVRAWCYVDDFIDGAVRALYHPPGETFNLGNPKQIVPIIELAEMIVRLTDSSSKFVFHHTMVPDVRVRVPSIDKAQLMLGYEPVVGLETGLEKTIEWYRVTVPLSKKRDFQGSGPQTPARV